MTRVYASFMSSSEQSTPHLTIGKLARLADVSSNAVRFYEREGLMQVPAKADSGYRLYDAQAVQRLRFIKQAQHCGFTLSEIQVLLLMRDGASSCCNDVRSKVVEKKLELESRIKVMKTMSQALDQLIADCRNDTRPTEDCSILATLSGTGKRTGQ